MKVKPFKNSWMLGMALTAGAVLPLPMSADSVGALAVTEQAKRAVNGRVSDSQGPLIGATVMEKGTSNGTVTDLSGRFSLSVRPGATLVVSYVGYVSQEVKADANLGNIKLQEEGHLVNEVVVIGYGTQRRALRLLDSIPAAARDCYHELLLFPVQAMANLYDLYYAQAMNRHLARQGNRDANAWADCVERCFQRDSLLCYYYNKVMAGGKWDGMMTQKHIGYTSWNDDFPRDRCPHVERVAADTPGGSVFEPSAGYVAIDAEHYYSAEAPAGSRWSVYPDYGRTRSAVALTPYTAPVGDARLTYRFTLPDTVSRVSLHVIVKSTLDFLNVGGHRLRVSLDGGDAVNVNLNGTLVDRQPYVYSEYYPTVARRVIERVVALPVDKTIGTHSLTLQPVHPGIVLEKLVVDFGGYQPSYLFGNESAQE